MSINNNQNFEDYILELEKIVYTLENESNISLEKSVELYERGKKLHDKCKEIIESINLKIETIKNE